jgi:iron complex outermembrane receptor protein
MKNSVSTLAMLSALSMSSTALAQSAPAASAAPAQASGRDGAGTIDEIVVTAQRREERLQDVPIAISAIAATSLAKQGVNHVSDLAFAVPGLNIERASPTTLYYLRGVGTNILVPGADPSVPTYVDGVYQSFPNGGTLSLNNVERIEVLRGPQGTLFGRNATGGLIQVITKEPTTDPHADISLGYGRFNTTTASAYVSGGAGIVAADLAVNYSNQTDGWGKNLFTPAQAGNVLVNGVPITVPDVSTHEAGINKDFAIASKVVIRPTDDLTVKLRASYARNRSDEGMYSSYLPGSKAVIQQTGQTIPYTAQGGYYDWNSNARTIQTNKQTQVSADINYEMPLFTVHSITAYIDAVNNPFTYSPAEPTVENPGSNQYSNSHAPYKTFSQELQILSPSDSPFQWIIGGYYGNTKAGYLDLAFYRGNFLEKLFTRHAEEESKTYAAFAQASFNIEKNTQITGGIRYTRDNIATSQYYIGGQTSAGATPITTLGAISSIVPTQKESFENVSYRASIDHHFSEGIMVYGSFNTGYKAGIFNAGSMCLLNVVGACPANAIAPVVKPEKLKAYEIGLKSELFDRMVRFNIAGFYYDYTNLQVSTLVSSPLGTFGILNNAAKARIKGVDADVVFAPTNNLSFTGGMEILNAKYLDYPGFVAALPRTATPFGNANQPPTNVAGNYLTRAPKFTANAGVNYDVPLNTGELRFNVNYSYNGGFYWDSNNRLKEGAFGVLNGEVTYASNDSWSLKVWGRNIAGTKYSSFTDPSPFGDRYRAAAPATYGVTVNYKY